MHRGELALQDGENLLWRNKAVLVSLTFGWVVAIVVFVALGQSTPAAVLAVFGIASAGWSEYSRRRQSDLVEYFVTDGGSSSTATRRGGPTLRAIDHAQRVFEHVQRARGSAEGTPAE